MHQGRQGTLVHKHEQPTQQAPKPEGLRDRQQHETEVDTEAGMLSGVSRKRSIRSSPCWFTEFRNSQCLSHFAAPFIVVRAETSVAESCIMVHEWTTTQSRMIENYMIKQRPDSKDRKGRRSDPGLLPLSSCMGASMLSPSPPRPSRTFIHSEACGCVRMILPQVHLRKPCYDFSFL